MVITLALSSEELNDEHLQELTNELRKTLVEEAGIKAELVEGVSEEGTRGKPRGEPITIGLIALTFLTSGAAVAMFDVFKSLFNRRKYLELEMTREDGKKITIKAENISLEDLKGFLGN